MDHHFIVSAPIENYAEQYSNAEPPLLKELRQETYAKMAIPQMLSGPLEGAFLKLLILATSSKHVLEIGTFTGYSALMMAEAVSEDGEVVTCEIDVETAKFAQKYFDKSPYGKKIRLKVGAASEILKTLEPNFDFIFVDADKENYPDYYEKGMGLLKPGGLMVFDNALWGGRVLHPETPDDRGIHEMNERATKDSRVLNILLTLRDGIQIVWKKK